MTKKEENYISAKGIKVNNLQNIDIKIPQNSLTVITGVSGSGKSSLAFDTLFAEGQRRYIESLSSYARQFIGRMPKPEVERIENLPPAIAVHQRTINRNPRSTVGTMTEIYEYLKLLFTKIGKTFSPVSGKEVRRDSVTSVVDTIIKDYQGEKVYILCPAMQDKTADMKERLDVLLQMGYTRLFFNGEVLHIEDLLNSDNTKKSYKDAFLLIDRLSIKGEDESLILRLSESIRTAFNESEGACTVWSENKSDSFSNRFERDGIEFIKPTENFFSFNNKYGACPHCDGLGYVEGISEDLVITKPYLSLYDNVVNCWKGAIMSKFKDEFIRKAYRKFPVHKPYNQLTEEQRRFLWNGDDDVIGINQFFDIIKKESYKIQYRVMLAKYRGKTLCPECKGTRLRKEVDYVKIGGKSLIDILNMPVEDAAVFFDELVLDEYDSKASERILKEIKMRLNYLLKVGLGYLTLSRQASTLSGGEAQRIILANGIGSPLVGSMYILDEPTIGLHTTDTDNLIQVLKDLRDAGNTVIVVEHDEEVILSADWLIDIGPKAGRNGGKVIFQSKAEEILQNKESLTAQYLRKEKYIPLPSIFRKSKEFIQIDDIYENNLNGVSLKIPLNVKTIVCGVSGSGKSTLINKVLVNAVRQHLDLSPEHFPKCSELKGSVSLIQDIQVTDQNSIGRSSRSNPALYTGVFDDIRTLFASQPLAMARKIKPGYFSFNVENGGRCETCKGEGTIEVKMQFMADVTLQCEDCHGKRYNHDALEIKYKDKTISDVLDMSVDEASDFFSADESNICRKITSNLRVMQKVGLGYLSLGQSLSTLSGGEAQRIKLAVYLQKGSSLKPTLFVFDEPTTGLHFDDIHKLNECFEALIENGHSVVIIEHHLDIIKTADWIIELGEGGGKHGGKIIFEGTPLDMVNKADTPTSKYLKEKYKS
ncbi:MAG: excinuclease ABC subunit UvrA [Bacteroidales bacterium]|nr:excinuclease ABC subunit UvrA [Bacteroidales bacterium]